MNGPIVVSPQERSRTRRGLDSQAWLLVALFLLLVVNYWPMLQRTGLILISSEDMAHGFFAPLVAAYIVWHKRHDAWSGAPSPFGIALLAAALPLALLSSLGGSTTIARFAFLLSLAGCLLVAGGMHALRAFRFPFALLLFSFPIPTGLYGDLTMPLQLATTRGAEVVLELLGFSVIRDGNILELPNQKLSVIEACSGLRSLITLFFFCTVYAYFLEPRRWLRLLLMAASVPAAILLNMARIVATGVLGVHKPEWTQGHYHDALGWLCFAIAFGLVFCAHRGLVAVLLPPLRQWRNNRQVSYR